MHSMLEQEILSQPKVITRLLEQEITNVQRIVAALPPFDYIVIAARGSSDHAAIYAQYAWAALAGYPVALATPSLYTMYQQPPRLNNALVVGISQSGQSPDIVAVLEEGKRQGRPMLAITNDGSSPLAQIADHVVVLHAGLERSVAATKTYTAQLAVMMLFAAALSEKRTYLQELQQLPAVMETTLRNSASMQAYAEQYKQMQQCVVIGRGYNHATSLELSLKLKELTYVMSTAYSSADFRHGPIATIDEGVPTILIMPSGATYADMQELVGELQQRGAALLIISDQAEALARAASPLSIPTGIPEWLSPIVTILPGQLLALHLTLAKGLDPDVPRGLQKVTRTY